MFLTAAVLSQTAPAVAQTSEITGDTTGGATWFRPYLDGNPDFLLTYTTHLLTILNPAAFSIYVPMANLYDPYIYLYAGAFDPLDPLSNLVAADDDSGDAWGPGAGVWDALLTGADGLVTEEGAYTLVVTGFCCGDEGTYTVYLDGIRVGWGLSTSAQLDELRAMAAQSGRQGLRVLTGNIVSALAEGQATRALSFSTKGGEPASDLFLWVRMSNSQSWGDQRGLSMPALQIGADWTAAPGVVAGLSLSTADLHMANSSVSLTADQMAFQPYLGWTNGNWRGSASVVLGQVDYDRLVSSGGTASAKGELRAATLDIARDIALPAGGTIAPFAALRLGQISLTETAGSLAATGIGTDIWFNEARIGATYTRALGAGTGQISASLDHFDTNAPISLASGTFDQTGFSGTIGLGYEAALANGVTLAGTARLGGLGTGTRTGDVGLTFRWAF